MSQEITFEVLERELKKQGFTKLALVFINSQRAGEYYWNWRWLSGIEQKEIDVTCKRFAIVQEKPKMMMGGYLIN